MRSPILFTAVLLFANSAAGAANPAPQAPPDHDTVCASVYSYLAEAARSSGLADGSFNEAAMEAQQSHLAANPRENPQIYAETVINGALAIRDGLASGQLSTNSIMATATGCNASYGGQQGQAYAKPRSRGQQR